MIVHIPSGKLFENRLECKMFFGNADYNRRVRRNEFTFHDGRVIRLQKETEIIRDEVISTHIK